MSRLWKKQAAAFAALAAAATLPLALPAVAQKATTDAPVLKSSAGIAHKLEPSMLQKNDAKAAGMKAIKLRGKTVHVSPEQMAAYEGLSPELRSKLGPAVNGQVLGADVINDIKNGVGKRYNTVMCPW